MAILSRLLVKLGVDESGVDRGVDRAIGDLDRLGDAGERLGGRGRTFGEEFGRGFGDGFTRDSRGRLHDSLGRFVKEGHPAGAKLGTSIVEGVSSTGPPGIITALAAGLSLLPVIGAIASAGLVLAFGAAFTKIGLKAAATNKGVQKEMDSLKKHVDKTMKRISKPFVSTWHVILGTARKTFDKLAPELGKAFKHIAPALSRFVKQLGKGFEKLGPSLEPLGKAFGKLLDSIGPALPGMFDAIAKAITDIANTVAENPDLFADFFVTLIKAVPWIFKLIGALAKVYVWVSNVLGTTSFLKIAFALLLTPIILIVAAFKKMRATFEQAKPTLESLWQKTQTVFQQIWMKINTVVQIIKNVITTGFNFIKTVVQSIFGLIKAIIFGDFAQVKAQFFAGAAAIKASWLQFWTALKAATSAAWALIKRVVGAAWGFIKGAFSRGVASAKATFSNGWAAIRSAASSGASRLIGIVKSLPGRIKSSLGNMGHLLYNAGRNVVLGLINGIRSMAGAVGNAIGGIAQKIRDHLPFSPAKEGPLSGAGNPERAGAKIAAMVAGGMTGGIGTVGRAAAGVAGAAAITPAGVTSPAGVRAAGANGGGPVITIRSGGGRLEKLLVEILRAAIAESGGNVQTVIGRS